jgi:LPS export ABC transporter protein LptC
MINTKRLKLVFLFIIVTMLGISSFYIFSYEKVVGPSMKSSLTDTDAEVIITDLELTESSGNQLLWSLNARTAKIFNEEQETRLNGVRARFFDEQRKPLNLTGDEGVKSDKAKAITITGNVVAVNEEGITLRTQQLVYDMATGWISSEVPVTIEKGHTVTTGEGFKARTDIKAFKFDRRVKTTILQREQPQNESYLDSPEGKNDRFVEAPMVEQKESQETEGTSPTGASTQTARQSNP